MNYLVIGTASQFAITDFGFSLNRANAKLADARFSNSLPAKEWLWTFATERKADAFVARCNSALAFQAGRLGRWITPCFVSVKTSILHSRKSKAVHA